ncbi:hypothetical protein HRbin36_00715 [bacterium HR36]|nr:hypothetical protein HRbin36_00715 [bacterium HR36]
MVDLRQKSHHTVYIVEQGQFERFQLECDLQTEISRIVAEAAEVCDSAAPLLLRWNDFLLPNIFAQDQKDILGLVFVSQVEVGLAALEMEPLHGTIEIHQAEGDAGDADNGQTDAVAFAFDQTPFADVHIERIGEDVNGVEADLFGHADAPSSVTAGLYPGGVDQTQAHDGISVAVRYTAG